jgi:hypothetical protein
LHGIQVVECEIVVGLCLHERGGCSVEVAARGWLLGEELLSCSDDRSVQIDLALAPARSAPPCGSPPDLSLRLGFVGGLSGLILAFVVERCGGKITVFQLGKKLARLHARTALDIEGSHGRSDLG